MTSFCKRAPGGLAALSSILVLLSGPAANAQQPPLVREATALVAKFVAADTMGDAKAAEALWYPSPPGGGVPYCELAAEGFEIMRSAAVLTGTVVGDSVRVSVRYKILGHAWSEDPQTAGRTSWRFKRRVTDKTFVLSVVRDSVGKLWIACIRRVPPNHLTISKWRELVPLLDSRSLEEWNAAVRDDALGGH